MYLDNISLTPVDVNEILSSQADSTKQALYELHFRHNKLMKQRFDRINEFVISSMPKTVVVRNDTGTISNLLFSNGSSFLAIEGQCQLKNAMMQYHSRDIDSIVVDGYTDNKGENVNNLELSKNRAFAVADYLSTLDTKLSEKIIVHYFGSAFPISSNLSDNGKRQNRRVCFSEP